MSWKHGDATTPAPPPPKSSPSTLPPPPSQKAARLYPVLSLVLLILLLLSAGAGIALSAVVLFHNFESTQVLDPLSRAVFFVASCVSLAYVSTHVVASRTAYTKNYGSPRAYGKYVSGLAFLLARLGLLVWVAAVTFAIFVAVNIGLDVSKGVEQNISWLNVIISIASFFILASVLAVIEMVDRPFATIGLSQPWFVRGEDPLRSPDLYDLKPGLAEIVSIIKDNPVPTSSTELPVAKDRKRWLVLSTIQEKKEQKESPQTNQNKPPKRKRKTLTKKNPYVAQQRKALRLSRSMSMPTPLDSVFADFPESLLPLPDSSDFKAAFAWKPPTREGTPRANGAMTFEDLGAWKDRVSLRHTASDISTNASAPSDDIILPSMPRRVEYPPRSLILLPEQQKKYDVRRWTAIGMRSPSFDASFADVFFNRPPTPMMTMEDEDRMLGRDLSMRHRDWEAASSYQLRMSDSSRPTSSRTSRTSHTSGTSRTAYAMSDEPPLLLPVIAVSPFTGSTKSFLAYTHTMDVRPDSGVLPIEGRRRRRLSTPGDKRRFTLLYNRPDSRVLSQVYRPSSRDPAFLIPQELHRPSSPTPTVGSDIHNFSRPRTSAAARMQSQVAKRLKTRKLQRAVHSCDDGFDVDDLCLPTSSTSSSSFSLSAPGTPGTFETKEVVAAHVKHLQESVDDGSNQAQKLANQDGDRPPSPETPRTARATAVRTLQEKLGKRMMRRNNAVEVLQTQLV